MYLSAFDFSSSIKTLRLGLRRRLEGLLPRPWQCSPGSLQAAFVHREKRNSCFFLQGDCLAFFLPPSPQVYTWVCLFIKVWVTASPTALTLCKCHFGASSVPALALFSGVKGFLSEAPAAATRCRKGLPAVLYSLPRWPLTAWQQPKQSSNFHALGPFACL